MNTRYLVNTVRGIMELGFVAAIFWLPVLVAENSEKWGGFVVIVVAFSTVGALAAVLGLRKTLPPA